MLAGSTVGDGNKFKFPEGIAIDKNNNIYVSDTYNHKIKKIDQQGNVITIAGSDYGDGINFKYPKALTVDTNGNIFVVDSGNNKIKKISTTGLVSTFSSLNSSDLTNYIAIEGITIDSSNNLYVTFGSKIIKIDPTGNKSDYHTITGNNSFLSGSFNNNRFSK
ncbi:MAG: hypothetical protein HC854_16475 [Flavobacterium sp.]|nr:hypothetical protein [Flavobacterium sp.]